MIRNNPYRTPEAPLKSREQLSTWKRRRWIAMGLMMTAPAWMLMAGLQTKLLEAGIINTRDLAPLAGNETGTVSELLLNVWHWDAAICVLFLLTIPNTAIALLILRKRRPEVSPPP